ncbi:MAG: YidC/Oxa1 family membrane protein insertase [bacterium]
MKILSDMMIDALRFFSFFGGYGWGIIWLTIAVNLALYPLTLASIKSMGAMQKMQPKLKALQEKYKDDPKELQKETMGLYKSEGINPLGGCLPMLLKIPFFLALFWAFQSTAFLGITSDPLSNTRFLWINGRVNGSAFGSEQLIKKLEAAKLIILDEQSSSARKERFVWNLTHEVGDKMLKDVLWGINVKNIDDLKKASEGLAKVVKGLSEDDVGAIVAAWDETNTLAKPDRVETPFGPISLLAFLVGITTFFMQKSMPAAGSGDQAKTMAMIMPVFLVFICWNFPAGVQLYWLVSNAVAAMQQYYIMRKA